MSEGDKSSVGVNVCGNTHSFDAREVYKKVLRHPLKWVALRKSIKQTDMATLYKLLNYNGLPYAVKRLNGVFHRLNTMLVACLAPMNAGLGLSKGLILSSLNIFLGSSKNSFLLV
jgi:hypothetical protein